ncbi:hotdog fold thioesterase [candidate division KSB1 bacterium]|nr:hotdog fold thioesterase [candidate division KSB1 bacterium]NIV69746.1 hotdog fold thioesterase [Phycisphaerae bacterium]NIT71376.1 hotdog fold thioesterase [candidate division KSB1 bacterium]NIU25055.1 hotdog fold thioesterase [candidate division KSB1 bacterium]NIU91147.1 hotdog fold thioesterase [candidate division KSB1 bacterium]
MTKRERAEDVVHSMLNNDPFSKWLGIEVVEISPGSVTLRMKVRKEMLNGFGYCHGGVTFSLADSALAFAANSHGKVSLLVKASMSYPEVIREGDILTARTEEQSLSNSIGIYTIIVTRNGHQKVGIFQGTVYRTRKDHMLNQTQSYNQ